MDKLKIEIVDTSNGLSNIYFEEMKDYKGMSKEEVRNAIIFNYETGNFSCDCNRSEFLYGKECDCGYEINIKLFIDDKLVIDESEVKEYEEIYNSIQNDDGKRYTEEEMREMLEFNRKYKERVALK